MNIYLAQEAIKLPGMNGTPVPINYPTELKGFFFQGSKANLGAILNQAIPLIIAFAGLGLLFMLISAGYTFLTSAGDAKKMEQGKQRLTLAVTGFLIVFAAYWFVQIAGTMFGLKSITEVFK